MVCVRLYVMRTARRLILYVSGVQAYHAGTVRSYLAENANVTVEAYGVTVQTIVDVRPGLLSHPTLSNVSSEHSQVAWPHVVWCHVRRTSLQCWEALSMNITSLV